MNAYLLRYSIDYGLFETGLCVKIINAKNEPEAIRTLNAISNEKINRYYARQAWSKPYFTSVDIYDCEKISA